MKFTENKNAPNCRILAKQYLKCRMDNQLMEQSDWESLGLVNLPGEKHVDIGKLHNHDKDKDSSSLKTTATATVTAMPSLSSSSTPSSK